MEKDQSCRGKKGTSIRVGEEWTGWSGSVAHPQAPRGGGGPGDFGWRIPLGEEVADSPGQMNEGDLRAIPLDSDSPKPPNLAPETNPRDLGNQVGPLQDALMDVLIDAKIVEDGTASGATHTTFSQPGLTAPGYETDPAGKIKSFRGKFTWKGTIVIQTLYGSGEAPNDVSCYGRGTTEDDIKDRDISLGFHEHCHRQDYEDYLSKNSLPDPPELKIGMPSKEYEDKVAKFKKDVAKYWLEMKKNSVAKTDEVGYKKSTAEQKGECFSHLVP